VHKRALMLSRLVGWKVCGVTATSIGHEQDDSESPPSFNTHL